MAEKIFEYFKTPKGTELPLIDLKGKPYLKVPHRLVWFREECPKWSIETDLVAYNETSAIACAVVKDELGRIVAKDFKQETKSGFPDFIEKAVTGAVGRALGLCGFGTQFAPELDEGDRLADSPTERPQKNQSAGTFVIPFGHHKDKQLGSLSADECKDLFKYLSGLPERKGSAASLYSAMLALSEERAKK